MWQLDTATAGLSRYRIRGLYLVDTAAGRVAFSMPPVAVSTMSAFAITVSMPPDSGAVAAFSASICRVPDTTL